MNELQKIQLKNLRTDLHSLISRWKNKGFIDDSTYKRSRTTDDIIPRAYGLAKIHKQNYPLRIIVSSINSPFYNLTLFLHNIINNFIIILYKK